MCSLNPSERKSANTDSRESFPGSVFFQITLGRALLISWLTVPPPQLQALPKNLRFSLNLRFSFDFQRKIKGMFGFWGEFKVQFRFWFQRKKVNLDLGFARQCMVEYWDQETN